MAKVAAAESSGRLLGSLAARRSARPRPPPADRDRRQRLVRRRATAPRISITIPALTRPSGRQVRALLPRSAAAQPGGAEAKRTRASRISGTWRSGPSDGSGEGGPAEGSRRASGCIQPGWGSPIGAAVDDAVAQSRAASGASISADKAVQPPRQRPAWRATPLRKARRARSDTPALLLDSVASTVCVRGTPSRKGVVDYRTVHDSA